MTKNKFYKNKKLLALGIILLVVGTIGVGYGYVLSMVVPTVTVDEAYGMMENATFIDVRSFEEYNTSHIQGAITISFGCLNCFKKIINQLDKNKLYIVYCNRGVTSKEAVRFMESCDFTNIYSMDGGFEQWEAKGYPDWS